MLTNLTRREQKEKFQKKSLDFYNIRLKTLKEHIFERKEKFFFIELRILNARQFFWFINVTDLTIRFLLSF